MIPLADIRCPECLEYSEHVSGCSKAGNQNRAITDADRVLWLKEHEQTMLDRVPVTLLFPRRP